jgi:hypothetical protein
LISGRTEFDLNEYFCVDDELTSQFKPKSPPLYKKINIIQHTSPTCRLARTCEYKGQLISKTRINKLACNHNTILHGTDLMISRVLRELDDEDIASCNPGAFWSYGLMQFVVIGVASVISTRGLDDFYLQTLFQTISSAFLVGNANLLSFSRVVFIAPYLLILGIIIRYFSVPRLKKWRNAHIRQNQIAKLLKSESLPPMNLAEATSADEKMISPAVPAPPRSTSTYSTRLLKSLSDWILWIDNIVSLSFITEKSKIKRKVEVAWRNQNAVNPVKVEPNDDVELLFEDLYPDSSTASLQSELAPKLPKNLDKILLPNNWKISKKPCNDESKFHAVVSANLFDGIIHENSVAASRKKNPDKLEIPTLASIYRNNHITSDVEEALRRIIMLLLLQSEKDPNNLTSPLTGATLSSSLHPAYDDAFAACKLTYAESLSMIHSFNTKYVIHDYSIVINQIWQFFHPLHHPLSKEEQEEFLTHFHDWVQVALYGADEVYFQDFCQWFRKTINIVMRLRDRYSTTPVFRPDDRNSDSAAEKKLKERPNRIIIKSELTAEWASAQEERNYCFTPSSRRRKSPSTTPPKTSAVSMESHRQVTDITTDSRDDRHQQSAADYFLLANHIHDIVNFLHEHKRLKSLHRRQEDAIFIEKDLQLIFDIFIEGYSDCNQEDIADLKLLFAHWIRPTVSFVTCHKLRLRRNR